MRSPSREESAFSEGRSDAGNRLETFLLRLSLDQSLPAATWLRRAKNFGSSVMLFRRAFRTSSGMRRIRCTYSLNAARGRCAILPPSPNRRAGLDSRAPGRPCEVVGVAGPVWYLQRFVEHDPPSPENAQSCVRQADGNIGKHWRTNRGQICVQLVGDRGSPDFGSASALTQHRNTTPVLSRPGRGLGPHDTTATPRTRSGNGSMYGNNTRVRVAQRGQGPARPAWKRETSVQRVTVSFWLYSAGASTLGRRFSSAGLGVGRSSPQHWRGASSFLGFAHLRASFFLLYAPTTERQRGGAPRHSLGRRIVHPIFHVESGRNVVLTSRACYPRAPRASRRAPGAPASFRGSRDIFRAWRLKSELHALHLERKLLVLGLVLARSWASVQDRHWSAFSSSSESKRHDDRETATASGDEDVT